MLSFLFWRPQKKVFFDRICINETDVDLKYDAILSLAGMLKRSSAALPLQVFSLGILGGRFHQPPRNPVTSETNDLIASEHTVWAWQGHPFFFRKNPKSKNSPTLADSQKSLKSLALGASSHPPGQSCSANRGPQRTNAMHRDAPRHRSRVGRCMQHSKAGACHRQERRDGMDRSLRNRSHRWSTNVLCG